MSIRSWLGLDDSPRAASSAGAETGMVRQVVEALDHLPEEHARFIAAFGYVLGRVANADLNISDEEASAMEHLVMEHGQLPKEHAALVVQLARKRQEMFGATDNFLVTREFEKIATRQQKLALVNCLFAVAAAEDNISVTEDNEIRQIVSELRLDHPDFIAVRSKWKEHLSIFQDLPGGDK